MARLTGFTGELFNNMAIGSGAILLDPPNENLSTLQAGFQNADSAIKTNGEKLGGTSGGIEFETDVETINLGDDVDGLSTALRGAIVLDSEAVTLSTEVIEMIPGQIKNLNPRLVKQDILDGAVAASTTRGTGNAALTITANTTGTGGNSIRYAHVVPSTANATLSVTVSGNDITVNVATGATAGTATSTASQVVAAVNASAAAAALVTASLGTSDGTGIVSASAMAALTGGATGTNKVGESYDPRGYFEDADYHDRVVVGIESRDKQIRIGIVLYNCLVMGGMSMSTNDDMSPITVPIELTAMGDASRRDAATGTYWSPYRLLDFSATS